MFRFIVPTIILVIAGAIFFAYTRPTYQSIGNLKARADAYDIALSNSRELQAVRDELTAKYNAFSPEDIARVEAMLPDTVDSVQLVIDLDDLAQAHGLVFKNSDFDATAAQGEQSLNDLKLQNKEYRTSDLTFVVEGTYEDFQSFLRDLERSLRLIEIDDLSFSAAPTTTGGNKFSYTVDIVTYWLRSR